MARRLKAISLYTGIGGLDFGFEAAGFKTAVAVEMDSTCCRTIRLNRKWPVLEGDIHGFSSEEILETAGLQVGEADVLVGGPPCQPFSKSSYWVRGDSLRLADPRASTLDAYLRVLHETQPKSFLLENVPGLAYRSKNEGLELLIAGIRKINRDTGCEYSLALKELDASEYGVPQMRKRVFLVGCRDGTEFEFPQPTHGAPDSPLVRDGVLPPVRTAWDAIGDLDSPDWDDSLTIRGKWGDLVPSIPEGENYLWHTPRKGGLPLFGWRTRYWSYLLKLSKRLPSWTIQASPGPSIGPFHWRSRRLSGQEMCRLQTFPDGLKFDSGITSIQRMLGNAVPSLIAEVLALAIRDQLLRTRRRARTPILMPPVRTPVLRRERVRKVADQYLKYQGDHDEHPGTGGGPAARQLRLV